MNTQTTILAALAFAISMAVALTSCESSEPSRHDERSPNSAASGEAPVKLPRQKRWIAVDTLVVALLAPIFVAFSVGFAFPRYSPQFDILYMFGGLILAMIGSGWFGWVVWKVVLSGVAGGVIASLFGLMPASSERDVGKAVRRTLLWTMIVVLLIQCTLIVLEHGG